MRLQLFLARAGICSRRKALEFIKQGRVSVDRQKILEPSCQVVPSKNIVFFDGRKISLKNNTYLLFNKPKGITTTRSDPFAAKTLSDILPRQYAHLHPVGRLDRDTKGLLLLTNDGELTFRITHPKFKVEKTYKALLDKPLNKNDLLRIARGLILEDGLTLPCKVRIESKFKVEVTLREGRKRQVRRMFESLGYRVLELKRVREGCLSLGSLPEGKFRQLTKEEVRSLYREAGLGADLKAVNRSY
ncbi:MAG: rRNA pseudouridine synthase [Candidatus Omnitrophica bacterium]|nr:rRNA pseudouridine synthase [Candidatus Omnitrophota bacterium]